MACGGHAGRCSARQSVVTARAVLLATGGLGRVYLNTHQPRGRDRRRRGGGVPRRRGDQRHRVRAVPSHRAARRGRAAISALRSAARRRRLAAEYADGERFMERYHRWGTGAARRGCARDRGGDEAHGRAARLARSDASRAGIRARAFPANLRDVPALRHRPRARARAGRSRRALCDGRRAYGSRRPHQHCRDSSPPARWRAPACTAPTGWPATRCSKAWCSARAPAARCARVDGRRRGRKECPARWRSPRSRSRTVPRISPGNTAASSAMPKACGRPST